VTGTGYNNIVGAAGSTYAAAEGAAESAPPAGSSS
jgi:hypothetical protein